MAPDELHIARCTKKFWPLGHLTHKTHIAIVVAVGAGAFAYTAGSDDKMFYDSVIRARERNRLLGRPLPKRAVGSTLLLKGLEADVSVILDAGDLDKRNLYVAMTRGSKRLLVCAESAILNG